MSAQNFFRDDIQFGEEALQEFLDAYETEIDFTISEGNEEYRFCTEEAANDACEEYIRETIWAFRPSFLASFTDLPEEIFSALQDKCEGANGVFTTLVERSPGGMGDFVEQAISADGRGHCLAHYDHEEHEFDHKGQTWFAYRVN